MSFNPETDLPLIVCPRSHAPLVHDGDSLVSTDAETRLQYEIRDGIPVLLITEATELAVEPWSAIMQRHGRDARTGAPVSSTNGQSG